MNRARLPMRLRNEDGAMLIMVAVSLAIGLLLLLHIVIGQGILYTGRGQAQNAADAGALAAAISLIDIDAAESPETYLAEAEAAARTFVAQNLIWDQPATIVEVTFYEPSLDGCLTPGNRPACVRVRVKRDFHLVTQQTAGAVAVGQALEGRVRLIR